MCARFWAVIPDRGNPKANWKQNYGATATISYDSFGALTSESTTFAGFGTAPRCRMARQRRLSGTQNPLSQSVTFGHDLADRVTSEMNPDGSVIGFRYDVSGDLVGVTPASRPEHGLEDGAGGGPNLYLYVLGDPVDFLDPDGQIPILPIIIGIGAGFAFDYILEQVEQALCDRPDAGTALGPGGNAALGGALGTAGPFAQKPRSGISAGGPGRKAHVDLERDQPYSGTTGRYSIAMRNRITSNLRRASSALGTAGAIIGIYQTYEAFTCG